jgi:hypothetical protein
MGRLKGHNNQQTMSSVVPPDPSGHCWSWRNVQFGAVTALLVISTGRDMNMRNLPSFFCLVHNYPVRLGTGEISGSQVCRGIGGEVAKHCPVNTCCIRMSLALNRCGHPISGSVRGVATVPGGRNGELYIFSLSQMITYLTKVYFKPKTAVSRNGFMEPPAGFRQRGIIVFWWGHSSTDSSTGHIDLWDGTNRAGTQGIVPPGDPKRTSTRTLPDLKPDGLTDQMWTDARKLYLWPAVSAP